VVTATRTPEDPRTLGSSTTIVTAEELEDLRVDTVLQALRQAAGIDVVQQGGPGRTTSVFIRGHNSQHTLVLIDGVRLNNNAGGGFDFANLPVSNIERIEIVRGAQSALYGSEAIGGVINIITKRGGDGLHGSVEGAMGTKGYRSGGLSLNGGNGVGDFSVAYRGTRLDGNTVAAEDLGNSEEDEWINHSLSGRFGLNFLEDGRADLTLNYTDDMAELDSFLPFPADDPNYEQERRAFTGGLAVSKPLTDWYTHNLNLGFAWDRIKGEDPDTAVNNYEITSETRSLSTKADFFPFEGDTLSLSYDFEGQHGKDPGSAVDKSLDIHSFLVQNHYVHGDTATLTAGVRYDDHEVFGSETTFRLAGSLRAPATGTRFHASYGTGFRAPTLNDLYWTATAWALGNPNLGPETSKGFDIGVEQPFLEGKAVADVTYFQSEVEDLIQWAATGPNWWDPWMPQNVADAEISGVETSLTLHPVSKLDLRFAYTYTEPEDKGTGKDLARRAQHSGSATATYRFLENARVTVSATHVGKRYDDVANATELDRYTRIDVAASYDITESLQVFGRVENVTDEEYEEVAGHGVIGRYGFAGVRLSF
jgi:vitamin B12 transporter